MVRDQAITTYFRFDQVKLIIKLKSIQLKYSSNSHCKN